LVQAMSSTTPTMAMSTPSGWEASLSTPPAIPRAEER
jgi:hypothetical protein